VKNYLIVLLFLFCLTDIFAQDDAVPLYRENEIGLNATRLIQNFIKIGDFQSFNSLKVFSYKSKRNDKNWRFRSSLGIKITDGFTQENNFFHLALGLERLNDLGENWKYFYGAELVANNADVLIFPNNNAINDDGAGFSFALGIMYSLNPMISFSTESALTTFIGSDSKIEFFPPFSIQINFYTKKYVRKKKSKEKSF